MTVDIKKLEELAKAAKDQPDEYEWYHKDGGYGLDPADLQFIAAANPAAVLELIAENAGLKTGYEAYELANAMLRAECKTLRKDKDRLDALEGNFWDIRHSSEALADSGDYTSGVEVIGHWMDKPFERVIGENYNENLRAAIDQAMAADAYPPARPEYEFEIPDFGGGNGNKARRKAAALGIDYDAAMSKEAAQ